MVVPKSCRNARRSVWLVAVVLVAAAALPPGAAASTRAEYVAQADPICQTWEAPIVNAMKSWKRNVKHLQYLTRWGSYRAWVNQAKHTGRLMQRIGRDERFLYNQIASLEPPVNEADIVGPWISACLRHDSLWISAGTALKRLQIGRFNRRLGKALRAEKQAFALFPSEYGFQHCW